MYDCDPRNRFRHPCAPAHGALAKNERKKGKKKLPCPPPSRPTSWLGAVVPRAGQLPPRGIVGRYKPPRATIPTHNIQRSARYKNNCGNCYVGSATGRSRRMKAAANHHVEGNLSHRSAMIGVLWHSSRTRHTSTPHLPINPPFRQANLTCDAYSCRRSPGHGMRPLAPRLLPKESSPVRPKTAEAYLLRPSCPFMSISIRVSHQP